MAQYMDLNLYPVFEVIYDTRNLTQAAQVLNKTQPAVSNALARLRLNVGDPLFVQGGKQMNPTPVADELIGPVRQALALIRGSLDRDAGFEPQNVRKKLRLSIGDIGEVTLLPHFIKSLRDEAPGISFEVFHIERRLLPKKLAANEIDMAIDIPMSVEDSSLRQLPLSSDRQVCVMSHRHHLAQKDALSLEDYLECEHIHVSARRKGGGVADIGLGKIGEVRNNVVRLQHHQGAFRLLELTDLVLSAPASLAKHYDCKIFELPFDAPSLDLQLYWHSSTEQSALSRWLRQKLTETAEQVG
jgi:DNA-binding transcriptional LysR family regulator